MPSRVTRWSLAPRSRGRAANLKLFGVCFPCSGATSWEKGTHMTMTTPFRLRGKPGMVTVEYGVNEEPTRWGYDLLDLDFPLESVKGFPYCSASVAFEAEGYAAILGWIQIVQFSGTENNVIVDVA